MIDLLRFEACGQPLTKAEVLVLSALVAANGRVVTRADLLMALGYRHGVKSRTVDVHVVRIRAKLGSGAIRTVAGVGYRLGIGVRVAGGVSLGEKSPAGAAHRPHEVGGSPNPLTPTGRGGSTDTAGRPAAGCRG